MQESTEHFREDLLWLESTDQWGPFTYTAVQTHPTNSPGTGRVALVTDDPDSFQVATARTTTAGHPQGGIPNARPDARIGHIVPSAHTLIICKQRKSTLKYCHFKDLQKNCL